MGASQENVEQDAVRHTALIAAWRHSQCLRPAHFSLKRKIVELECGNFSAFEDQNSEVTAKNNAEITAADGSVTIQAIRMLLANPQLSIYISM